MTKAVSTIGMKSTLGLAAVAIALTGFAGLASAKSVGFGSGKVEFARGAGDGSGGGKGDGSGGGNGDGSGGGNQKFKNKAVAPGGEPQIFNQAKPQKLKVFDNAPVIIEQAPQLKANRNSGARVIIEGSSDQNPSDDQNLNDGVDNSDASPAPAFVTPDPSSPDSTPGQTAFEVQIPAEIANGMTDGSILDPNDAASLGIDLKSLSGYTGHEQLIVKLIVAPATEIKAEHKNGYKPQIYNGSGYVEQHVPAYTPTYTYEKPVYHQSYSKPTYSYDHNSYEGADYCAPTN